MNRMPTQLYTADLSPGYPAAQRTDLGAVVLMPGLVSAHHHSGLLRGTAEHLPVWEWLRLHIDPMHRVLRPEEAEAAGALCYAEGLLAGTTTIVDMWRYLDGAARAASQLGNRLGTLCLKLRRQVDAWTTKSSVRSLRAALLCA
jgi:5-methylthioadenosine/S-adenosylhomocysteine deaminase